MAQKLKGVGGVLGGLISPDPAESDSSEPVAKPATAPPTPEPVPPKAAEPTEAAATAVNTRQKPAERPVARRGRPPGKQAGDAADKEKVTLRLGKALMDEYREWSWEERCQLGELVERALIQYHKNRHRQKSQ